MIWFHKLQDKLFNVNTVCKAKVQKWDNFYALPVNAVEHAASFILNAFKNGTSPK